jgi:hypothetical protein
MKILLFIIGLTLSFWTFAQKSNARTRIIKDLRTIDSLFRQLPIIDEAYLLIDYENNNLKFYHYLKYDTISKIADSLITTANIDSSVIRQYCNKTKINYYTIYPLFVLMIKNKFAFLEAGGFPPCEKCCLIIHFDEFRTYLIRKSKSKWANKWAFQDCVWPSLRRESRDIKSKMISDDILLLKNW